MNTIIDYSVYLVTDRPMACKPLEEIITEAVSGGVGIVQLREKTVSTRLFLTLASRIKGLLSTFSVPLIINDRVDIALAVDAAGVHVGQDDMPCQEVRNIVGSGMIIGVSVSTPAEAVAAEEEGADYLGISPIYETPTKTDTPPAVGLAGLKAISAVTTLPLIAIGGLHAGNVSDVILAGADGIAVVSAIMTSSDPRHAAHTLRQAVNRTRITR